MKASVIIPVHNSEEYLAKTLENIAGQTHKDLEIICVIDNSADDSEKIAREFAAKDPRIKIIAPARPLGPGPARNMGAAAATGEYIHFMDSDDFITADFYEQMTAAANCADAIACDVFYEARPKHSIWFARPEIVSGAEKFKKTEVLMHGWLWRYLIRREFWNARGLAFPDLSIMEDMPAMVQMIYYAEQVALCPDAVYFYKNRAGSVVNADFGERKKNDWQKGREMVRRFMREHGIRRPNRLMYLIKRI